MVPMSHIGLMGPMGPFILSSLSSLRPLLTRLNSKIDEYPNLRIRAEHLGTKRSRSKSLARWGAGKTRL
jgi:hypothetical protein